MAMMYNNTLSFSAVSTAEIEALASINSAAMRSVLTFEYVNTRLLSKGLKKVTAFEVTKIAPIVRGKDGGFFIQALVNKKGDTKFLFKNKEVTRDEFYKVAGFDPKEIGEGNPLLWFRIQNIQNLKIKGAKGGKRR